VSQRIERVRAAVDAPFLATNAVNVRYLTGFRSSNAAALIEADRVRLFADFRYAAAGRRVEGVEFVETTRNLIESIAPQLPRTVAFEAETLTFAAYETLRAAGLELLPTREVVLRLRAVKDEQELAAIRRAAEVGSRAFARLAAEPFAGRSEAAVAWRMEQLLHDEGAQALSFPVIVAAGPNAANPHTTPGERTIGAGETVVVDAGAVVDGYCSDCTRTFATGNLPHDLAEAYEVCLEAQLAGLDAVGPAADARDVDAVARRIVDASRFPGTFGHGLGHGVGLEVHESPVLRAESSDTLEAGNVTSVEPGVYLEGRGGIRIEDLVVVRDGAPEILTSFPKELTTVE
jgi:Xaa-Pro aminopeptidase